VLSLYTWRTALLQLAAGLATLAGLVADAPLLTAAGCAITVAVIAWTVRAAKRHPELVRRADA
jgi:hypothetical protein